MKTVIRESTFETNSSSSHSMVLCGKSCGRLEIPDGVLELYNDDRWDFGRGFDMLEYFDEKFAYYIASKAYQDIKDELDAVVAKLKEINPNFDGIKMFKYNDYTSNAEETHACEDIGMVDHQSVGVFDAGIWQIEDKFNLSRVDAIVEYLINADIIVFTDSDEREGTNSLFECLPEYAMKVLSKGAEYE